MLKRVIAFIVFMSVSAAYAGVFEDAMSKQKTVLLYLYSNDCNMCNKFLPVYNELKKTNNDVNFIKVDADTQYGYGLMKKFKGFYVPFVVLASPKTKKHAVINPYCSFDEVCIKRAIKSFNK